jgi:hypothetical protein
LIKPKNVFTHFYKLDNGKEFVREWLLSLDRNDRQIVGKDIQKIEFGWPIGMPFSCNLEKALYEACIQKNVMILLHGIYQKDPDHSRS